MIWLELRWTIGGGTSETLSTFDTNYDANSATVDVPIKFDLASDETLDILLSYSEALADNCMKDQVSKEENYTPISLGISPYLCGDGNPIWGIYKQLRKNGANYKRKMPAYFGGFHLVLETHKKRGSLFGDTHLRDIFRKWRPTDKQLDWVMAPGDPNQVDSEIVMYHLGEYTKTSRTIFLSFFNEVVSHLFTFSNVPLSIALHD